MTYKPAQATPSSLPELVRYLFRELVRVGQELTNLNNPAPTLHEEPARPVEGLRVIASAPDWDPGAGSGYYIYLNGSWQKII